MTIKLSEQDFLGLILESHNRVERENKEYYYTVDDYKIDNVYLAVWYENYYNKFVEYVSPVNVKNIKNTLEDKLIDLEFDYNINFLKKLRQEQPYLQFFLSGGIDSTSLLTDCVNNDIFFDEIVSIATGDSINLTENIEIKESAVLYAELFKGSYGKYSIHYTDRDFTREYYQDPMVHFRQPEIGGVFPTMRQSFRNFGDISGKRILGLDKPQLIKYKNQWYTVCYDYLFNGCMYINQAVKPSYDSTNIKSLIVDSIKYRNYLLKNNLVSNKITEFFTPGTNDNPQVYNRHELKFLKKGLKQYTENYTTWPEKDVLALHNIIKLQDLELFVDYSSALKVLVDNIPNFDFKSKKISNAKFCWAIDIDNLEVYTQKELIPNGFEE